MDTIKNRSTNQVLVSHPCILTTWEAEIWRITVQGQPGEIVCETPISKITRATEQLLCRCEALSENPSPTKKKKKVKI
jgi:hypothetical protein